MAVLAKEYDDLKNEFMNWCGQWPFDVVATFTKPYFAGEKGTIPVSFAKNIEGCLKRFEKNISVKTGSLGVLVLAKSGYLHAHVLLLKEDGQPFEEEERNHLERLWPHNAKVDSIENVKYMAGYLASKKHLEFCKEYEWFAFGETVLNLTKPTLEKGLEEVEQQKPTGLIGEIEKSDSIKIRIAQTEWQGKKGLDIREYVKSKNGKPPAPTKKGVRIPEGKIEEFIQIITDLSQQGTKSTKTNYYE